MACAVPRARGPARSVRGDALSESTKSQNATLVIVEARGRADVWCTSTEGWRRAGGLQLTDNTLPRRPSTAAVFWREAGVFCRALGRRSGRLAAGLRARAADAPAASSEKLFAAGRGKGAWRVSEAPLNKEGAFERRWARPASCAATATACWSWRTRARMTVTYGAAGIETTTLGRAPGAVAAAPVAGGVALLAEGFVCSTRGGASGV